MNSVKCQSPEGYACTRSAGAQTRPHFPHTKAPQFFNNRRRTFDILTSAQAIDIALTSITIYVPSSIRQHGSQGRSLWWWKHWPRICCREAVPVWLRGTLAAHCGLRRGAKRLCHRSFSWMSWTSLLSNFNRLRNTESQRLVEKETRSIQSQTTGPSTPKPTRQMPSKRFPPQT